MLEKSSVLNFHYRKTIKPANVPTDPPGPGCKSGCHCGDHILPRHRSSIGEEGYLLIMSDTLQLIAANTEIGSLLRHADPSPAHACAIPAKSIIIIDWPAFRHRVVMDDISRGPVSSVDFIKAQIRRLAEIRINYLTFYIEHVIQTASHPDIAPANGKLSDSGYPRTVGLRCSLSYPTDR